MRTRTQLALLCFFASMIFGGQGLLAQLTDFALQDRIVELYDRNKDALVRVKAVYPPLENETAPRVVIGTGFFISREGLILTNQSIVANPVRVWVEHNNIAYSADIIGSDIRSNIALLRTNTLPRQFSFLHLADSADLPPIGAMVLRLSMPLEFAPSPKMGLVSGFESKFGERFFPCLYIRTSIPAGPGDGGAAYLDSRGQLLGIQVGSLPDVSSSYILPARAALRIRDDLLFSGEVVYGWIGFEVNEEISIQEGERIVISEVFEETPAEKAGLLPGDVLMTIGDYPVRNLDNLRNAMFYTRVGQFVDVVINRDGKNINLSVQLSARPDDEPLQIVQKADEADPLVESPFKEEATDEDQESKGP